MQQLNLPTYPLKVSKRSGKPHVFDIFRKRFVVLTPEEWVRQHFLWWLTEEKAYPQGLIAVEAPLQYNRMDRRADAIIYGKNGKPLMIIECKAADVPVTQDVFDQVARYNVPHGVAYLIVTNGLKHYCCFRNPENNQWHFLDHIPEYERIADKNPYTQNPAQ